MSPVNSLSVAAAAIKLAITAEVLDPKSTVESDRQAWIDAVADVALADGTVEHREVIAGVPCRRVSPILGEDLAIIVYAHGGGLVAVSSVTHVGARQVFEEAGFTEISHPTARRVVMRIDLDSSPE